MCVPESNRVKPTTVHADLASAREADLVCGYCVSIELSAKLFKRLFYPMLAAVLYSARWMDSLRLFCLRGCKENFLNVHKP